MTTLILILFLSLLSLYVIGRYRYGYARPQSWEPNGAVAGEDLLFVSELITAHSRLSFDSIDVTLKHFMKDCPDSVLVESYLREWKVLCNRIARYQRVRIFFSVLWPILLAFAILCVITLELEGQWSILSALSVIAFVCLPIVSLHRLLFSYKQPYLSYRSWPVPEKFIEPVRHVLTGIYRSS